MDAAAPPRGNPTVFKVFVWLFAVASLGGLLGISVITAWFENSDGGIHRVHYMGYGALYGVLLTTGFIVQNWHPERKISAFYQILDVGLAQLLAAVLATSGPAALFGVIVLVAYAVLFALHPYRPMLTKPAREGFSPLLMILTVGGAVPLIGFAVSAARLQRTGLALDPHVKGEHWSLMASMAIGIVLVAFLSCFKFPGWKITARSAGAALFFYGLIAAVYPHKAGSNGTGWSLAAVAGGLVFVAAAEWESRGATSIRTI